MGTADKPFVETLLENLLGPDAPGTRIARTTIRESRVVLSELLFGVPLEQAVKDVVPRPKPKRK
jgi:hypothetical protein